MPAEFRIKIVDDTAAGQPAPAGIGPTAPPGGPANSPRAAQATPPSPSRETPGQPSDAALQAKVISPLEGLQALASQLGFGKWIDAADRISTAAQAIKDSLSASKSLAARRSSVTPPTGSGGAGVDEVVDATLVEEAAPVVAEVVTGAAASAAAPAAAAATGATAAGAAAATTAPAAAGGAAAGGAAGGLAALAAVTGPVGIALAALGATVGIAAYAAKKFGDAMQAEASRLADWSAKISLAMAQSDINRQLAELRRAERLGDDLAEFESARSEAEIAFYELGTEIKHILLTLVKPLLPVIEELSKFMVHALERLGKIVDVLGWIWDKFSPTNSLIWKMWEAVLRLVGILEPKEDDGKHIDPFTKAFLDMGFDAPIGAGEQAPIGLPAGIVGGAAVAP